MNLTIHEMPVGLMVNQRNPRSRSEETMSEKGYVDEAGLEKIYLVFTFRFFSSITGCWLYFVCELCAQTLLNVHLLGKCDILWPTIMIKAWNHYSRSEALFVIGSCQDENSIFSFPEGLGRVLHSDNQVFAIRRQSSVRESNKNDY